MQKIGRSLDFKGKHPITFDKSNVKCYNCHRKGNFAKECKSGRNQGKRSYGDNGRRNATTNEPSSQALVAQDGLGGYDWRNDFDEPVNYALMAISSSSSSSSSDNEVQNCSKQFLKSFKTLQKKFDSERERTYAVARLEIPCNTNEVNIEKPKSVHESVVPKPKINKDKVIIEDWNSDDDDDVSAIQIVSPVKTNETQTVRNRVDKIG
ncbi:ribonuclease H-like domain-containing protein [Tanacetum coccineum]